LEFLLNVLVFALCAAVVVQVFVAGKLATTQSAALSTLTMEAKDLAGYYKVGGGEVSEFVSGAVRGSYGELSSDGTLTYYYDSTLQLTLSDDASYRLVLTPVASANSAVKVIEISAHHLANEAEEELFSFEVVNYRPRPAGQGQGG